MKNEPKENKKKVSQEKEVRFEKDDDDDEEEMEGEILKPDDNEEEEEDDNEYGDVNYYKRQGIIINNLDG